jgi:uncharacterized protein YndB with AHSA1/START domain
METDENSGPISEREIVVTRSIQAPRRLVFEAYTDVNHLSNWWGPDGFTTTTHSFEFGHHATEGAEQTLGRLADHMSALLKPTT